jgi:peptidoglycan/LPS O-acetylase OafA/YrhL
MSSGIHRADRNYYPALDGLRGLAILLVVVYHNFGFINVFLFGWLGVDLFFVLSGFLITDILLASVGEKNFLRNFFVRRMLRIFPLYYLALVLFLLIIPRLVETFNVDYYRQNQVWLWTYLQNWLYIFKNPNPNNVLNHLWSLAVEEQFYLLWPFVILLIKKPRYLLVIVCLVLVGVLGLRVWVWKNQVADFAYFNLYTFTRIDGICIGCIVALLLRIDRRFLSRYTPAIVLFFALLNFAFFFINRSYDFGFPYLALAGYTTFAMIFGLLVNEAVTRQTKLINSILSISFLRFFGRISYGLYIFHWPLYILLTPWLIGQLTATVPASWLQFSVSLAATVIAIAVSWLSFNFYERPFLKIKERFQ